MSKRELPDDQEAILVKLDKDNDRVRDIRVDKNEFTIGRARDCDEILADVFISRRHVVLKCDENGDWTVTHTCSTVTLLNNSALEKDVPSKISHGDLIQFSDLEEYKFVFTLCAGSNRDSKKRRIDEGIVETMLTRQKSFAEAQEKQRRELEDQLLDRQKEQNELRARLEDLVKNQETAEDHNREKIAELQTSLKSANDAETQLQRMHDRLLSTLEQERTEFENRLIDERRKWQEALDLSKQEKEAAENNLKERMNQFRVQQQAQWAAVMEKLVKQEKTEQERLVEEKAKLEEKLKQAEDALKEQSAIAEQLRSTIPDETIVMKDLPNQPGGNCIFLQLTNDGTTERMEILETIDLTVDSPASSCKKDNSFVDKVGNIMNEELTCSVCSELFIKAVTLNCTHSFCQYCIQSWMKKKRECPVCRAMITAINRSIVLDNVIEQMIENLSSSHQARRKQFLNERLAEEKKSRLSVPKMKVKQKKK